MNDYNSNKKTGKALIPRLRFPEFQNSGEWEVKTIGDILNSQSSTLSLNKLKIKDKGYAVYGAEGIIGFIDNFQHNEQYISIVKDGSGVGRLNLCQAESSILGTLSALKVRDNNKHSLIYTYYLLNTLNFSIFVKGAGIPHIYYSDYKEARIGVPSLPEQQKIASCLSSIDEVIAGERQRLELLKAHKKGLLQNLFPQEGETVPKLRFPEFKDSGEWVEKKLGEVLLKNDKIEKMIHFDKEKLLTIKLHTLGVIKNENTSTRSGGANYFKRHADQFIFSKIDFLNGAFGLVPKHLDGFYSSSDLPAFSFNSNINPFFFINWLKSTYKSIKIERTGTSSTLKRISLKDFFKIKFLIPSLPEQQKIASCLSSLDDLIQAQQQKIKLLEQHKKGLLQGLFPNVNDVDNG